MKYLIKTTFTFLIFLSYSVSCYSGIRTKPIFTDPRVSDEFLIDIWLLVNSILIGVIVLRTVIWFFNDNTIKSLKQYVWWSDFESHIDLNTMFFIGFNVLALALLIVFW